ncbi:hypothetical protein EO244_12950 [Ancylomarina salipaludis]|uniref:Uncharacterized protein n=1 Tax=Ancylomarina salipaludis TaxID=2501299 RepID=A0A4Q1JJD3_9BACT|nr:hypothetical protein [Ancylomarina salipaludis]RXQ91006.1 hypothetical protein EO244_12950 [Ancylomarina salipaludis]
MKYIALILVLYLSLQMSFAQKQNLANKPGSTWSRIDQAMSDKQVLSSDSFDIARNSGGKHGEGRLPTAYSKGLDKIQYVFPLGIIDRNSDGKQSEGRPATTYSMSLKKGTEVRAEDDIARNSGGRNSE